MITPSIPIRRKSPCFDLRGEQEDYAQTQKEKHLKMTLDVLTRDIVERGVTFPIVLQVELLEEHNTFQFDCRHV